MGATVRQDWERDGFLIITGAPTIKRYQELCNEKTSIDTHKLGIFFAFSKEQFSKGYKDLVERGFIKDGDKVCSCFGGYGKKESFDKYFEIIDSLNEKIKTECDPYEVYLHEFNNYECCISWDGDEEAVRVVIRIFGREVAEEALQGRRKREFYSFNDIIKRAEKR